MAFGMGFILGVLTGAIWGAFWMLVLGVLFMLVSGVIASPPLGAAAIAGALAGAIIMSRSPEFRTTGLHIGAVGILVIGIAALSGFTPLGVPLDQAALWQAITFALIVGAVWASTHFCLRGMPASGLIRYKREVLIIRVLTGLGFVVFTVVVALPFYVMVMTSLKSQQALLANPLDLSLDVSQGVGVLFRSYVELFTQYNFGTFLLNSTIVSVATVLLTLFFAVPGAYAVARLKFPGQAFLSRSILLIYMVPAIVLVIPLYAAFSQLGLRNTLTGLLV
ncbi:MAG: carbohydrate ABC transporter permease, partial [Pseudomonadota bacterium]